MQKDNFLDFETHLGSLVKTGKLYKPAKHEMQNSIKILKLFLMSLRNTHALTRFHRPVFLLR